MFRKQDFKKVDLLGSGKKNTKIYKAEHIPTGKYYAIKEVEAKTLDKLNEYKVSPPIPNSFLIVPFESRKKQYNFSKFNHTPTCFNSSGITSTRRCTTLTGLLWFVSTWTVVKTWNISSVNASSKDCIGNRKNLKR